MKKFAHTSRPAGPPARFGIGPRPAALATASLLLTLACPGQGADRAPRRPILVEAQDEHRKPLVGATIRFYPTTRSSLQALQGGTPRHPRQAAQTATTRQRGRAMIRPPQEAGDGPPFGALLTTFPAGDAPVLGALQVGWIRGLQVRCTPMAEVHFGKTPVHVDAQAVDVDGLGHDIGSYGNTTTLRLPAGRYRLMVRAPSSAQSSKQSLSEHIVQLRSGTRHTLPSTAASPRRLALPTEENVTLVLAHRPHVALPVHRGHVILPSGDVPLTLLELTRLQASGGSLKPSSGQGKVIPGYLEPGEHHRVTRHSIPASSSSLPKPTATGGFHKILVRDHQGSPIARGQVLSLRIAEDDHARAEVLGISQLDASGAGFHVRVDQNSVLGVLVLCPGFQPESFELDATPPPKEVRLKPSRRVPVQILGPRGEPAALLRVDIQRFFRPSLLDTTLRTSSMGQAQLDLPPGHVTLRLRGDRILDQPMRLTIPSTKKRLTIRARPGFAVRGIVLGSNQKPAAGAVVTLRDSTGQVDLRRTAITGTDGRFTLRGLPEHIRLRLSATRTRGTRSEISSQIWAEPDPQTLWELRLRSEDPVFPGQQPPGKDAGGRKSPR